MRAGASAGPAVVGDNDFRVFDCIGKFLAEQRLSPDPLHYAFAYRVVTDRNGPLAKTVAALTDGGVRLSSRDIEGLGGEIGGAAPPLAEAAMPSPTATSVADGLVARTQMQVDGFSDIDHPAQTVVHEIHAGLVGEAVYLLL